MGYRPDEPFLFFDDPFPLVISNYLIRVDAAESTSTTNKRFLCPGLGKMHFD